MSELIDFLKARLDEDMQQWSKVQAYEVEMVGEGRYPAEEIVQEPYLTYVDHFNPARVLREVEAKRQLLQEVWTGVEDFAVNIEESRDGDDCGAREYRDQLLGILALAYSDHPDFQEAWRV